MAWQVRFPVGELVEVVPTHVDRTTGNFFVQLSNSESEKLDELMGDIEDYVATSRGRTNQRTRSLGEICLAKFEDESWYRARVLGVDPSGTSCQVFFVDYGNSDVVDVQDTMEAPERFLHLPPQCHECELGDVRPAGGQWSSNALVRLADLLVEHTFAAEAVSLKPNNVIVLRLFGDAMKKSLAVESLVATGYLERLETTPVLGQSASKKSTLVYRYIGVEDNTFEDVYISHSQNPGRFYCQLLKNTTALRKLMDDLDVTYREAAEDDYPLTSCCQDNPCCARFSEDKMWYRAVITSESPSPSGEIEVKYVDYGNSETVHLSNLMELDPKFLDLPVQAIECKLYGIKPKTGGDDWPTKAAEQFNNLTHDKHLVSYISKCEDNRADIFLFDTSDETKDVNFSQIMVESNNAIAMKPLDDYKRAHRTGRRKSSFGVINLVPNCTEDVLVTSVTSPSEFYCQLLKHAEELDTLMGKLTEYYEGTVDVDDTITLPQPGMLCCGNYTEDDGWYRALITASDIASREVQVLYVDYGNTETLPISRIKELKPQFTLLPQQAIACSLYGISPNAPTWKAAAITEFQNSVLEKELKIHVISQSESQRYSVRLLETVGDSEYSINKQLVQKGYAMSDAAHPGIAVEAGVNVFRSCEVEVGNYLDIEVTHIDNLDHFWCHLMSSGDEMESLMAKLQDYYQMNPPKNTDITSFVEDGPCCARFSEDDMWYRGKVVERLPNKRFKVQFVDYGNSEVLSSNSVAVLNPEFLQLPVQAIHCSLSNLTSPEKNNDQVVNKFQEMVSGRELVCRIDEVGDGGRHFLLIIDSSEGGARNINEELAVFIASGGKEGTVKEFCQVNKANIPVGSQENVYITSVSSPRNFFCQLAKSSGQLDALMNQMEEYYRPLTEDEDTYADPQAGEACCAMFTEDDGFYRAIVTTVTGKKVEVTYLDYGNSEALPLSRLKVLNRIFTELPAQAFNARLDETNVESLPSDFGEKVADKELIAKIVKKEDSSYVVQLSSCDGVPLFYSGGKAQKQVPSSVCKVPEPKLSTGSQEIVYITAVTGPHDFFCQLTSTASQLDELMNEIEEYYRPLGNDEQAYTNPQVGEACCAMFTEDDGWYRASVTKLGDNTIEVHYLDYGNSEMVALTRVKILNPRFSSLPAQGFHATLSGSSAASFSNFEASLLEKELSVKILRNKGDRQYEVELFALDGTKMFTSGGKQMQQAAARDVCKLKEATIAVGSKEHVYITSITSCKDFFCQLIKTSTQLDALMNEIEEYYRPLGEGDEVLSSPQIGEACCALFTEDDGWYRAVVTQVTSGVLGVCYVDYGNSEEIPVSRVKRLVPCFANDPAHGFKACLSGSGDINTSDFNAAIGEKEVMVKVGKKTDGVYEVEVFEMGGARMFGGESAANKQTAVSIKDFLEVNPISCGDKLDVCGAHSESPNQFYCQLVKKAESLEKIMCDLAEVYSDLGPEEQAIDHPVVGMFCAARFIADDAWYRAQVVNISSPNEVEVCYVDFGNRERTSLNRLKKLAPAFQHTPAQALLCSLRGAKEDWNQNECETFEILILEQHLIADVKAVDTTSKSLTIDLYDTRGPEDLNILDVLRSKTGSTLSTKQPEKLPKLSSLPELQLKSTEKVVVESAESLDSFVCQISRFDHDLDTVADKMYEKYHQGDPPGPVTVPLQIGDLVAAMFSEDETWYRASVFGQKPDGAVEVLFIDYGNREWIGKGDIPRRVKPLNKDVLHYPTMRGVACFMSRVGIDGQRFSWTPRAHDAFVQYVVGKAFRVKIDSEVEPYCVILEDDGGSIHSWLARERLVSRDTEPEVVQEDFYELEVQEGTTCHVYVTSVVNPEQFYVQQAANGDDLDKVMDELHKSCVEETRGALVNVGVGSVCAAQYTVDDAWYRGRVRQVVGPDAYEVEFVDYGNSEVLPMERLKELDASLLDLPAQALQCCLELKQTTPWTAEINEQFETMTVDKSLKMTVKKVLDEKLLVTMMDEEGLLVNDTFDGSFEKQGANESKPVMRGSFTLARFPITQKQVAEVFVSHIVSPAEFYVQFSGSEADLEVLAEQCAGTFDTETGNQYVVNSPIEGMFCCAKYSEDGLWYRGQITILDSTEQTATVHFVDHGNSDVVHFPSDLRLLTPEICTTPCQAIRCSLQSQTSWTAEQTAAFEEAVMDKPLQATFNEMNDDTWLVMLSDGGKPLNQLSDLQLSSTARETPDIPKANLSSGDEPLVYLISVSSPDDVILQLASHVPDLESLMADVASNPPQDSISYEDAQVSAVCLGRFTADEAWYRARVLECYDKRIRVRYVDYGNEEWLTEERLAPISSTFCSIPEVSFSCVLEGVRDSGTWGENSGERLMELYGEKELTYQVLSVNVETVSVKLLCDGEDITKALSSKNKATTDEASGDVSTGATTSIQYARKILKNGERKNIFCSHIDTPDKLWCQLVEDQEELDDLMNLLDTAYGVLGPDDCLLGVFNCGTPCCGQFLEDDGWYRAEILGKDDEGIQVRYVDYGNVEVLPTSRIRCLMSEFSQTPRQALAFQLSGIQAIGNEWSPDALTLVEEFTSERSIAGVIKTTSEPAIEAEIYGTDEEGGEESLNKLLVEKGFAVAIAEPTPVASVAGEGQSYVEDLPESQEVASQLAYPKLPAKIGDEINLFYVTADSPASIWCQLSDTESDLLALMESLGAFYSNLSSEEWQLEQPVTGAVCCAQFTEDDSWYRGEVLRVSEKVYVRFVDYGNSEELPSSRVKQLKSEFASLPEQAVRCCLAHVSPESVQEWTDEKGSKMEQLCSEKCYVGKILGIREDALIVALRDQELQTSLLDELTESKLVTKLSETAENESETAANDLETPVNDSELSVNELDVPVSDSELLVKESEVPVNQSELPVRKSGPSVKYSQYPFRKNEEYTFHLVAVESPENINVQDPRGLDKFTALEEKIQEAYSLSSPPLKHPEIDAVCCAEFEGSWYRGEVLSVLVDGERAVIYFVDWGNMVTLPVANLKELDSDLLELPEQALSLSLAGLAPREAWDSDVIDKLKELCDCDTLTSKIIDLNGRYLTVELYSEKCSDNSVNRAIEEFISWKENERKEIIEGLEQERHAIGVDSEETETNTPESTRATPGDNVIPEDAVDVPEDKVIIESPVGQETETNAAEEAVESTSKLLQDEKSPRDNENVPDEKPPIILRDEAPALKQLPDEVPESVLTQSSWAGEDKSEAQEVVEAIDRLLGEIEAKEETAETFLVPEAEVVDIDLDDSDFKSTEFFTPEENIEEDVITPSTAAKTEVSQALVSDSVQLDDSVDEKEVLSTPEVEVSSELQASEEFASLEAELGDTLHQVHGRKDFTSPDIRLGDIHKVVISHVQTPSNFYCQLSSQSHQLNELMDIIQKTCREHTEDTHTLDTPTDGTPCCAQSPDDNKWYRAVITKVSDDDVEVFFVDFGNTTSIPLGRLKMIDGELVTSLPRQALHCSLVDLEPADSEWSAEAVTKMREVCMGKELEGIFRAHRHKKYDVYLRDPENDVADFVNKLLVDLKLAKVTGRNSESDEGADLSGNEKSSQGPMPASSDDQQLVSSSSTDVDQEKVFDYPASDTVPATLEDLLDKVVDSRVERDSHADHSGEIGIGASGEVAERTGTIGDSEKESETKEAGVEFQNEERLVTPAVRENDRKAGGGGVGLETGVEESDHELATLTHVDVIDCDDVSNHDDVIKPDNISGLCRLGKQGDISGEVISGNEDTVTEVNLKSEPDLKGKPAAEFCCDIENKISVIEDSLADILDKVEKDFARIEESHDGMVCEQSDKPVGEGGDGLLGGLGDVEENVGNAIEENVMERKPDQVDKRDGMGSPDKPVEQEEKEREDKVKIQSRASESERAIKDSMDELESGVETLDITQPDNVTQADVRQADVRQADVRQADDVMGTDDFITQDGITSGGNDGLGDDGICVDQELVDGTEHEGIPVHCYAISRGDVMTCDDVNTSDDVLISDDVSTSDDVSGVCHALVDSVVDSENVMEKKQDQMDKQEGLGSPDKPKEQEDKKEKEDRVEFQFRGSQSEKAIKYSMDELESDVETLDITRSDNVTHTDVRQADDVMGTDDFTSQGDVTSSVNDGSGDDGICGDRQTIVDDGTDHEDILIHGDVISGGEIIRDDDNTSHDVSNLCHALVDSVVYSEQKNENVDEERGSKRVERDENKAERPDGEEIWRQKKKRDESGVERPDGEERGGKKKERNETGAQNVKADKRREGVSESEDAAQATRGDREGVGCEVMEESENGRDPILSDEGSALQANGEKADGFEYNVNVKSGNTQINKLPSDKLRVACEEEFSGEELERELDALELDDDCVNATKPKV